MTPEDFTPAALRAAAEARAGADDYGSDSYMAGLEPLLYSIAHEANLNDLGRREVHGRIVGALANRLTVQAWASANPELANVPIEAPLVVLGLPRTGSSILHETLAAAPGMRTPLIWEVRDFALAHNVSDAGMRTIEDEIARKNQAAPGYAAMHYEDAHIPMECVALTLLDLVSTQLTTISWSPTYRRFLLGHDATATYQWHKLALRYLQATRPGARWVLKAPMHSLFIKNLMAAYPDALLVQTHRDPITAVASVASLNATLRQAWSDTVPLAEGAASDAAYTAEAIGRAVAYRAEHPDIDARVHDVAFKSFMADQEGTLQRLYAHLGLPFTEAAREAMMGYLNNRPREKHGRHDYSLETFGLTREGLEPLFAPYVGRHRDCL